ncbi:hypothetical protein NEF87_002365 [Candidatus Lokiarchaeum ossiferum]|uniref:Uncharacterized protein n=1 Tax=Candidatus Lokiarchaeum ossiferum TaxID=2951803 RepID=A0ABY6HRD8_9ARCH|nr:hypothetical protein NEF87_002365 [Candidatus Lokiarchaeum sp. B-35]
MNFLTFKIIIGDDPGAKTFKKLARWWNSIRQLDENDPSPEHFWMFYQLGDFDQQTHIIKWEIWSTWRLKQNFDDFNKGIYIGATCGLFFYYPDIPASYAQLKKTMNVFFEKRKTKIAPFFIVALSDLGHNDIPTEQQLFIESNGGKILPLATEVLDKDMRPLLNKLFKIFLQELDPERCRQIDIQKNYWALSLEELQKILYEDKNGIKIRPRHTPPLASPIASYPKTEEQSIEVPRAKPGFEARKLTEADLTEEERKHIAISPDGDIVLLEKDISQDKIVEMVSKGYQLPAWIVVPRHCPKCLNQNQAMIREVIDRDNVLMQYPTIYGKKYICGNCGNDWH